MGTKFLRLTLFFIGLLLFVFMLPHSDPWHSTNIVTSGAVYQDVTIKFAQFIIVCSNLK